MSTCDLWSHWQSTTGLPDYGLGVSNRPKHRCKGRSVQGSSLKAATVKAATGKGAAATMTVATAATTTTAVAAVTGNNAAKGKGPLPPVVTPSRPRPLTSRSSDYGRRPIRHRYVAEIFCQRLSP
ncbi:hypothetical protein C8R44DRAFT_750389 [Mycena epipterygia]|nr:hypothetical protein C8R44DRAFT_750389 [Mycena epipterygia]